MAEIIRQEAKDYGGLEIRVAEDPDNPVYLAPHLAGTHYVGEALTPDGVAFVDQVITDRLMQREIMANMAEVLV